MVLGRPVPMAMMALISAKARIAKVEKQLP